MFLDTFSLHLLSCFSKELSSSSLSPSPSVSALSLFSLPRNHAQKHLLAHLLCNRCCGLHHFQSNVLRNVCGGRGVISIISQRSTELNNHHGCVQTGIHIRMEALLFVPTPRQVPVDYREIHRWRSSTPINSLRFLPFNPRRRTSEVVEQSQCTFRCVSAELSCCYFNSFSFNAD